MTDKAILKTKALISNNYSVLRAGYSVLLISNRVHTVDIFKFHENLDAISEKVRGCRPGSFFVFYGVGCIVLS